jgi:hypothetical protein
MDGSDDMNDICREIVGRGGRAWEFELAAELLREGLAPSREFYSREIAYCGGLPKLVGNREAADYVQSRLDVLGKWTNDLMRGLKEGHPVAFGQTGSPGNPDEIELYCGRVSHFCGLLMDWERDVADTAGPPCWSNVFTLLRGLTTPLADTVFKFADDMASIPARAERGETAFNLDLSFPVPRQLQRLPFEIKKAWTAGAPIWESHPILTMLTLQSLFK